MQCPACPSVQLVMSERQGIEIDYCPQCRGVWLDRGELDKIIDRSSPETATASRAPAAPPQPQQHPPHHPRDSYRDSGYPDDYRYRKKKREGFLSNIFDFD